jgi:CBS domain-containing protein
MRVAEIMTESPACCSQDDTVQQAARLMEQHDCGCLPVVDGDQRVTGVVTDRDIACRCVAQGKDATTPVSEVMTAQASCCGPEDDAAEAARIMAEGKVRRVPVVDGDGRVVGMVAQADLARHRDEREVGEVVEDVSQPTGSPSDAGRLVE